jgi:pseudaminic acid cytidylyltransferase
MKILIVPARSGSKRIKDKNIKIINNKPMLIHSLQIAKKTGLFDKIHLSTDSDKYIRIANSYGFKTDFKREKKLSDDNTPVLKAVRSDLKKFFELGYKFSEVCVLSATSPLLNFKDLIKTRKIFCKFHKKFPIASVARYPAKIERGMKIKNGKLKFINKKNILKKTQTFSESYYPTGNIFYSSSEKLIKTKHYNFNYIPYMIETFRAIDIDNADDLKLTKKIYKLL